jgi:hypothetical protein
VAISGYWNAWDISRGITLWSGAPAGTSPGGWVMDGFGGLHQFGSAPAVPVSGYWNGWDIARSSAGAGAGSAGKHL